MILFWCVDFLPKTCQKPIMSTLIENADRRADEARNSLRSAEERLNSYMNAHPTDFTSAGYLALSAEVTRCTAVLAGAQQTLQLALAAQNRGISAGLIAVQRVTLHQYLQTIPPYPDYSDTLPGPSSTTPKNVRHPQLTVYWENFQRDTLRYIETAISHLPNDRDMPVFPFGLRIGNEVPALQICVALNLFDVVAKQLGLTIVASERQIVGNPDGFIVDDASESIRVVYEIKGKWTLNHQWFDDDRIDMFVGENLVLDTEHNWLRRAVNQIYTYMVVNSLQYGILSSYDHTFFLKRVKIENATDGYEQLIISSGIAHNATNPTVLQSIAYFLSLADGATFSPPPTSPPRQSSRISSRPSSTRSSRSSLRQVAEVESPTASENEFDSVSMEQDSESSTESDFALEDFNIKSVLGTGRTKVYYESKNQVALKAIDLWKQSDMLVELQHEIEMYRLLSDLQGIIIPKLVLHGYWEGGMYCIGFSLCGTVPKTLTESQKQSVLSSIDAIHRRGILHNDIKKENILVDENGKVYLIDFGFATLNSCEIAQEDERNQVLHCIKYL
jgi:predicted Ser/Thr protein kinase